MYTHPKLAWSLATYDVIYRNHSNWSSLNLSQNLLKGGANSYWKRQVLMFYPLGKNSETLYGGWGGGYLGGLRTDWDVILQIFLVNTKFFKRVMYYIFYT